MTEKDPFKNQKKFRKAELINPPNILKKKIGSGGIKEASLIKAQEILEENTTDFTPIATELIEALEREIQNSENNVTNGEAAIEALLYPAMQLKAQGAMFHFPLVTEVSDILVNFLETIENIDSDVLEIVSAHKMTISIVISNHMIGDGDAQGKSLKMSLMDACSRYYKSRKNRGDF